MIIIGPALKKEIYFLMAHIVQNGIKQALRNKEIYASGIHGQKIWIDPINEISIIMFSSRKQPLESKL